MMQRDLAIAREKWIKWTKIDKATGTREKSAFLAYRSQDGRFADFHSNRRLFISVLRPKMARTLARDSNIRLRLGVYTHVSQHDQTAAIKALSAPPEMRQETSANRRLHESVPGRLIQLIVHCDPASSE
jgi:hypothetical protein